MKRTLIQPTDEEDAVITATALSDPDAIPYTDKKWDVVEQFRASGEGWQTRMDAALKDWLKTHSPA